ncbi:MAG: twin-arginine translocase TatA/TatE family subunit [Phascolarctobacterium sp.]|uniref:twin-arginine translocase TatA/TatE family subunit n=1 Tax=Phascolarctobacterium sp. TaxID=2049039 RepID=UPI0025EC18BE|nr:twin-arginine translocase TatA/TatE family subunit [Phascolarctobacterium sp.]MCC8158533.1 twin-arginine translocase TatA/TatE family subunit [Phascolarctobacterium sp.]
MFGLGLPELLLILVIGLVFFGPGKLPDVGKAIGKSMREFKTALNTDAPADAQTKEAAAAEPGVQKNDGVTQ